MLRLSVIRKTTPLGRVAVICVRDEGQMFIPKAAQALLFDVTPRHAARLADRSPARVAGGPVPEMAEP